MMLRTVEIKVSQYRLNMTQHISLVLRTSASEIVDLAFSIPLDTHCHSRIKLAILQDRKRFQNRSNRK